MTACVYAIINLDDGHGTGYIGSTTDRGRRWRQHRTDLNRGRHHCAFLQRSWDKYGKDSFAWHKIERVDDACTLRVREQFWLDEWIRSGRVFNTGLDVIAPMKGRSHTRETRQKMCRTRLGRRRPLGTCVKISVARTWQSLGPMATRHRANISAALAGRTLTEEHKRKVGNANAKVYPAFVHSKTGEIIPSGHNLTKLCREQGLDPRLMWPVVHGKRKSHKGWRLLETNRGDS